MYCNLLITCACVAELGHLTTIIHFRENRSKEQSFHNYLLLLRAYMLEHDYIEVGIISPCLFFSPDSCYEVDDLADQISVSMTINASDVGKVIGHKILVNSTI